MRIYPISNAQTYRANAHWVFNERKEPLYKTTTGLLRQDLNWREYIYRMCGKYVDADSVNVLIHACSNGLEAVTFVLAALHLKPKSADKFVVTAKDIYSENIAQALSGKFEATYEDIARANKFTDGNSSRYLTGVFKHGKYYLKPCQEIMDRITFAQGDIMDDVDTMPTRMNILQCRNLWSYFTLERREQLIQKIASKFEDDSSTLVTGDYDFNGHLEYLLDKYNFEEDLNLPNVYTKKTDFGRFSRFLY